MLPPPVAAAGIRYCRCDVVGMVGHGDGDNCDNGLWDEKVRDLATVRDLGGNLPRGSCWRTARVAVSVSVSVLVTAMVVTRQGIGSSGEESRRVWR